jgi:hypothetical protein
MCLLYFYCPYNIVNYVIRFILCAGVFAWSRLAWVLIFGRHWACSLISPDGRFVLSGSDDGKAYVVLHFQCVFCILYLCQNFDPGTSLACACVRFFLLWVSSQVWETNSGHRVRWRLPVSLLHPLRDVAWHPSQHLIALGSMGAMCIFAHMCWWLCMNA